MLFYTNSNVLLFLIKRWTFLESGIPLVFFSIKLILPGLGFEPVPYRVAGRRLYVLLTLTLSNNNGKYCKSQESKKEVLHADQLLLRFKYVARWIR